MVQYLIGYESMLAALLSPLGRPYQRGGLVYRGREKDCGGSLGFHLVVFHVSVVAVVVEVFNC